MPYRERRNTAVLLTCVRCGSAFHPFKGRETKAQYCSQACATAFSRERMAAARAAGCDPAHGGPVAEKRRVAIAQRRAAGELVGRQPRTARTDVGTVPAAQAAQTAKVTDDAQHEHQGPLSPAHPPALPDALVTQVPSSLTPEERAQRDGIAYLASANRYEGLTAKLLTAERARGDGRTLIVAGYGAGLRVERDALIVTEGHTHYPQTPLVHTLYRGVHGVERIVCLNPQGSLSFPAVQWCAGQGITITLLDRSGHLLSMLTPDATADAHLRRLQYVAQATGHDVPICQELLQRKLAAQRAALMSHPDLPGQVHALDVLHTALAWLTLPELPPWLMSVDMVRTYEARTARAYFAAWDSWQLRWDKADAKRAPPYWKAARDRSSPLAPGNNARRAVDPLNAVLNYAYALLEGQCRHALTRLGFDVACGFLHLDKPGRDSLVYDLMECERGTVDGLVLDFLARTTLHYSDVLPVADGSCRLHPQLARAVVAACRVSQDHVDEHARWLREAVLRLAVQVTAVPPVQAVGYVRAGTTKRLPRTRHTGRVRQYTPF